MTSQHVPHHVPQHLSRTTEPERVARALRDVPLFATVPEPYFGEIAARIRIRHYAPGEAIFHQHDVGEGLYLVARGSVRIFLRSEDGQELHVDLHINDCGDAPLREADGDDEIIERSIRAPLREGHCPISLGGDHSVTYPVLRAIHAERGPVDMALDLWVRCQ